jgi:hypothetical protein
MFINEEPMIDIHPNRSSPRKLAIRSLRWTMGVLGLLALTGCSSGPPPTAFAVKIMNLSGGPISAGFVKLRGQLEEGWVAPVDIVVNIPALGDRKWGTLINGAQTKVIGPVEGHFEPESVAMLRIYGGDGTVEDLTLVGPGDPDRVDKPLLPGNSSYVIIKRNGRLEARPEDQFHATDQRPPDRPQTVPDPP